MVEAAGVEPASESTSSRDSTCVSASVFSYAGVRKRLKTAGHQTRYVSPRTPSRRPIASLFNGIWPPTTRRGQGRRSQLIKLRERTEYPQLTDVPSDLRVNGARHASLDSILPSKPERPRFKQLINRRAPWDPCQTCQARRPLARASAWRHRRAAIAALAASATETWAPKCDVSTSFSNIVSRGTASVACSVSSA